jgi:hypothetical protein
MSRNGARCTDARMAGPDRPAGQVFHWKMGHGEKVAGPLQPTLSTTPGARRHHRIPRRTGRHRSWPGGGTDHESAPHRRRAPALRIHVGQTIESQEMDNRRCHYVTNRRASGDVDHGLILDDVPNARLPRSDWAAPPEHCPGGHRPDGEDRGRALAASSRISWQVRPPTT